MENPPIILYVEDDSMSRKMMRLLLQTRLKIPNITIFEDSEDFAARADSIEPKPTVIFLDIHMKPYSGIDMLHMLRAMPWAGGVPIIALTASVMQEEVQELIEVGFDGCLGKPLDMNSFPGALEQIMNGEQVWRISS